MTDEKPVIDANELQFLEIPNKGSTKIYAVMEPNLKTRLGLVSMYGPQLTYCFWADDGARLDPPRLHAIAKFTNSISP